MDCTSITTVYFRRRIGSTGVMEVMVFENTASFDVQCSVIPDKESVVWNISSIQYHVSLDGYRITVSIDHGFALIPEFTAEYQAASVAAGNGQVSIRTVILMQCDIACHIERAMLIFILHSLYRYRSGTGIICIHAQGCFIPHITDFFPGRLHGYLRCIDPLHDFLVTCAQSSNKQFAVTVG